jgi:hypothetical protein
LACATNGCAETCNTISIVLTDCPTCDDNFGQTHHGQEQTLANIGTNHVTATVITVIPASTGANCVLPHSAEQPVVTLNADLSATIAWNTVSTSDASPYTYEVAWDAGDYWVDSPRQEVVRVDSSPYVWGNLNPLVTYRFAVRVVNDCGAGPFSESNYVVVP